MTETTFDRLLDSLRREFKALGAERDKLLGGMTEAVETAERLKEERDAEIRVLHRMLLRAVKRLVTATEFHGCDFIQTDEGCLALPDGRCPFFCRGEMEPEREWECEAAILARLRWEAEQGEGK